MFAEFMSQSNSEFKQRNRAIDELLQQSNTQNSVFREQQRGCLNELMETVVKGLDTAVTQRDNLHDQWLKSFLSDQLMPAIQRTISNVQDLEKHSENTTASFIELVLWI